MPRRHTLLFDLGGVIVRWEGIEALMALTGESRDAVLARFANDPVFSAFENGRCCDDDFAASFVNLWGLENMSIPDAKTLWNSWVKPTYDGTEAALKQLRGSYHLACLSNTNILHWKRLEDHIALVDYFDVSFASHLLGAAKPDALCYQLALDAMQARPEDVTFFDDTQINIDAARALGMTAHLVDRDHGVVPLLKELNFI